MVRMFAAQKNSVSNFCTTCKRCHLVATVDDDELDCKKGNLCKNTVSEQKEQQDFSDVLP